VRAGVVALSNYGVRLGSRASGLGHATAGTGKIRGLRALVIIAGISNLVRPGQPALLFFLAFNLLAVPFVCSFSWRSRRMG
jgi:hypothetical protein